MNINWLMFLNMMRVFYTDDTTKAGANEGQRIQMERTTTVSLRLVI